MQDLKINFDDKKMDPQVEFQLRNPLNWILYYFIGKFEQKCSLEQSSSMSYNNMCTCKTAALESSF